MAKKSKARTSKAKKSKAKTSVVTPTYLKPGTSFIMGVHDVVRALKVIEKYKHLDKFVRAAKKKEARVSVGAETVNFVKNFMVKYKMHNDPVGKHIVNARVATGALATAAGDPFRPCNFGR